MAIHLPAASPSRWTHLLEASDDRGVGADLPLRSWVFDVLVALVFTGVGSAFLPVFFPAAKTVDFVFVAGVNLPLLLRRRVPRIAFVVVAVAGLAQIVWPRPIGIHDAGILFALYSLTGYTNRRVGLVGLAALTVLALLGSVTDWWGYINDQLTRGHAGPITAILTTIGMLVLAGVSWASGERLRSSRIGMVALAERAATLEREQAQQSQLAAAAERARIAREMHDVIAHALSVMIAQADGAEYVIDETPGAAKQALGRISRTGRDSLTQMRGLLGLLREGAGGDRGLDPQPGLAQVPELLEESRAGGLQVVLTESGRRRPLPAMVELTLYRVIQESLTNARKHGGADVRIGVEFGRDGIGLTVHNAPAGPDRLLQTGPPGHGLTGMAERSGAVGGTLRAGADDAGGFTVTAWIPYVAGDPRPTVSGSRR